jgi:hypothetical protein
MKHVHTYTDAGGVIIFKTIAADCNEADKLFEKALGKDPLRMPGVTCMVTYEKG